MYVMLCRYFVVEESGNNCIFAYFLEAERTYSVHSERWVLFCVIQYYRYTCFMTCWPKQTIIKKKTSVCAQSPWISSYGKIFKSSSLARIINFIVLYADFHGNQPYCITQRACIHEHFRGYELPKLCSSLDSHALVIEKNV
jgi:hypothetical protein